MRLLLYFVFFFLLTEARRVVAPVRASSPVFCPSPTGKRRSLKGPSSSLNGHDGADAAPVGFLGGRGCLSLSRSLYLLRAHALPGVSSLHFKKEEEELSALKARK